MALEPEVVRKLRLEVDEYFQANELGDNLSLSKLKYLEAVINETLRLHPPVPSGVQRITPESGLNVGETFIPGNTIVQIPMHTLFRGL
jgi:cytochrome P450 family 628